MAVVHESVDQRGRHDLIAEDLAPLLEAFVAGENRRCLLVATGEELEEEQAMSRPGLYNPTGQAENNAVRMQIADYAQGLKAIHWDDERVVVAVLQVAREAGMTPSPAVVSAARLAGTDKLLVDMVRWAIEEYDEGVDLGE